MFINDQWLWAELSDVFIDWIECTESVLEFLPEMDFFI